MSLPAFHHLPALPTSTRITILHTNYSTPQSHIKLVPPPPPCPSCKLVPPSSPRPGLKGLPPSSPRLRLKWLPPSQPRPRLKRLPPPTPRPRLKRLPPPTLRPRLKRVPTSLSRPGVGSSKHRNRSYDSRSAIFARIVGYCSYTNLYCAGLAAPLYPSRHPPAWLLPVTPLDLGNR
ncbi:hypothetical protein Pcinc_011430 [Petrolisthes cinctipes]|uniref:Uncharacterized protein n=1 Tax=Petrolisthes cinctipes TaxID=88211 RepID=A0AAE1G194_PETCI|nr:hypothetical protein Pcinc_011430 [Petrolisthes cinctipes]